MAQGFDSSSDDEDSDIDVKGDANNNSDNWISSKPKPMELTEEEKNKIEVKQQYNQTISQYLAPRSLAQMKNIIYSNKKPNKNPPPPPLQRYDNQTNQYNQHRTNLNIRETMDQSKYPWKELPEIIGVNAQTEMGCYINDDNNKEFNRVPKIKLNELANQLNNVEFRPEEFVAVRMRLKNPKISITVFSNGKLTTQGGRSQSSCVIGLRKVARMIAKLKIYNNSIKSIHNTSFHSVGGKAHFGHDINLEKMCEAVPNKIEYSPDIESSYLKYRDPLSYGPKGSCHIHHNGRLMIMGCQSVKDCKKWMDDMWEITKPHFINHHELQNINSNKKTNQDFYETLELNNNQSISDTNNQNNSTFSSFLPPPTLTTLAPPPILT